MRGARRLLEEDAVSVVHADLDAFDGPRSLLSRDEVARAHRFRHPLHRDRYVAGRATLRLLLAERLDADPAALELAAGPYGKPRLCGGQPLEFSVSHSGADALFAFSPHDEVGVDIEHVRPLDAAGLTETCFSPAERRELSGADEGSRLEAFFDGWVRKEAVIKADGRGVSLGLRSFTVALSGPARMLEAPPGEDAGRWRLRSLEAGPGTRAAVAVRASTSR